MYSVREIPSASSMFSAYASLSATIMLFRSAVNELIPRPIRRYVYSAVGELFRQRSNKLTLVVEEGNAMSPNLVYEASEVYLRTKISPSANRLKVSKGPKENHLTVSFMRGERIDDVFDGIELNWRFVCLEHNNQNDGSGSSSSTRQESRHFELSFDEKFKERVLNSYLPFLMSRSKDIKDREKALKLCTLGNWYPGGSIHWETIMLDHPAKFETLAMDQVMKEAIMDDLDRFVRRREFYKRVGRAWKRGYLLYGPPGTGKSSLIAAIANHLKFDIYDLQLRHSMHDSDLRRLLLSTTNRSILVIEDIDCSLELPDRNIVEGKNKTPLGQMTLSGLLNFIDGLWSSCGDERILIFTTNNKDKLDPALLRPGRMDMHIHMSYLTAQGFKVLASNYLGINVYHRLFGEIERLIGITNITPAQVAEELMRSEDADVALEGVCKLLKRKKMENEESETLEPIIELRPELDIELSAETEEEVIELVAESVELTGETRAEAAEQTYELQPDPAVELET
ncbi:hypothetical protein Nepgr_016721 [Nepenthes gracilis]|uniref:AAA+ ATPase domain-containing protein n=1 Tax=Nepenthes gracilis TaxID=150966 RepID=A0AAD3XSR2_NEPGR|nr:hypothetical protein Nepgr_016721 [Nepenthes gracilis]